MSAITGQELADFLYTRKLPVLYRNVDESETEKQDLYRYLQAVIQGGFNSTLDQIALMTDLVNPLKCPVEYLPYLYQSFGLPYFEDIGEYYNRRFLASIGEFLRRRGTIGGVRYLVRVLTGMESEISYERVKNEKEHARYLHVYPVFPDVTSLAEIEVTAYTIKRFLDLHLPFYLRSVFFPFIEVQHLDATIHNGISFANTLMLYLFSEKDRTLRIYNTFKHIPFYDSTFYNLSAGEKGYKVQSLVSQIKTFSPLGMRALSYDLTKLTGKKLQIGNWTTNGDYKFRIPFYPLIFEVSMLNMDLFKPSRRKLQISNYRTNGIVSHKQLDLKSDDRITGSIKRIHVLCGDKTSSYDFTGLRGKKISIIDAVKKDYDIIIEVPASYIRYNVVKIQDATFIEGHSIIADYFDVYNHSYRFKIGISKLITPSSAKTYSLIKEAEAKKLICEKFSCARSVSIIQYDLRGDRRGRN